jgi:HlyD family secretion protein
VGVIATTGCGSKSGSSDSGTAKQAAAPPTVVAVQTVTTTSISRILQVEGPLATLDSSNLSPKATGRLVRVSVREGDPVRAGEVVAQLDTSELEAQVNQDVANVLDAKAKLAQAQLTYDQSITNANVAVEQAEAALGSAKSTLQKTIEGDQPQQKMQAKDNVIQQQANYDNAESNLKRYQQLYAAGAVAKSDLDNAETTEATQKALLDSYKQALSLSVQGGRSEDIEAARDVVSQDSQALKNAIADRRQVAINKAGILAAKATVQQDEALVAQARQLVGDASIVSPIDGVVSERLMDPGQSATAGQTVVQVVSLKTIYYQPTVSEINIGAVHVGQHLAVSVDAYPGQNFYGIISAIYPATATGTPNFSIRVTIPNIEGKLRPGMYARGGIVTETHQNAVVIPASAMAPAVQQSGFQANSSSNGIVSPNPAMPPQQVFVVQGAKAYIRPVEVGIFTGDKAEIISGLSPGESLVVKGESFLQDGSPVKIAQQPGRSAAPGQAGHNKGSNS